FLIFSLLRYSPRSTLFPYTTLFRSVEIHADQDVARQHLALHVLTLTVLDLGDLLGRHLDLEDEVLEAEVLHAGLEVGLHLVLVADRKSTRLNSSHRTISYAVFCLKK